ncbi:hypothetical protein H0537_000936 [Salmonella enterica]|nr:hypothetical protein [Salmonella enterica]
MKNTDPILNLIYAELLLKSLEELRSVMSEQSGESPDNSEVGWRCGRIQHWYNWP